MVAPFGAPQRPGRGLLRRGLDETLLRFGDRTAHHLGDDRAEEAPHEAGSGLGNVRLSVDEARALIAAEHRSPALEPAVPGLFARLFLPHPMTSGRARLAAIGPTIASLPVLASSMLALAIMPRTYRRVRRAKPGELTTPLLVSAFGVPTFGWLLLMNGLSAGAALGIASGTAAALFARAAVRARAGSDRDDRDLFEPPPKPREQRQAPPELPAARAQLERALGMAAAFPERENALELMELLSEPAP